MLLYAGGDHAYYLLPKGIHCFYRAIATADPPPEHCQWGLAEHEQQVLALQPHTGALQLRRTVDTSAQQTGRLKPCRPRSGPADC